MRKSEWQLHAMQVGSALMTRDEKVAHLAGCAICKARLATKRKNEAARARHNASIARERGKAMVIGIMAIGNNGTRFNNLDIKHPRKDLLAKMGRARAQKIFIDTKDGKTYHSGYIVGGEWFQFYEVHPWRKEE
jgi:hypothetical protein